MNKEMNKNINNNNNNEDEDKKSPDSETDIIEDPKKEEINETEIEDHVEEKQERGTNSEDEEQSLNENLSQISQVSGDPVAKTKKAKYAFWLIMPIILVFVLIIFLLSGHNKSLKPSDGSSGNDFSNNHLQKYDAEAQLNLERLKQAQENQDDENKQDNQNEQSKQMEEKEQIEQMRQFSAQIAAYQSNLENSHSKEYTARQNAPTSMYSADLPSDFTKKYQKPSANKEAQELTLTDNSVHSNFANKTIQTTAISATKLTNPDYTVASGEFIQAILETAIDSDLPGMIRAITTRPVYAYTGQNLLIPAGTRLIGQYSSVVMQGQNRVMAIWNRLILPNGISVNVNSPSTDSLGKAGQQADSVDKHFWARFGEASLLSIIGAGVANSGVSKNDEYNSASQYKMAISQSFQQSAQQPLQGTLAIKPTVHIYQGSKINVFVAHDLEFESKP